MFAYDYVGYSTSGLEGHAPSEAGCYRAITAAYAHLTRTLGIHPSSIVVYVAYAHLTRTLGIHPSSIVVYSVMKHIKTSLPFFKMVPKIMI